MKVDQKGSRPGPIISDQPQAEGVGGKKADLENLMQLNEVAAATVAAQKGKDASKVTLQEALSVLKDLAEAPKQ